MGDSEDYQVSEWDSHSAFSQQYHDLRWQLTTIQTGGDLEAWYKMIRVLKKHVWAILSDKEKEDITKEIKIVDKQLSLYNGIPENHPTKKQGHWKTFLSLEHMEEMLHDNVNKHVPLIHLKEKLNWDML